MRLKSSFLIIAALLLLLSLSVTFPMNGANSQNKPTYKPTGDEASPVGVIYFPGLFACPWFDQGATRRELSCDAGYHWEYCPTCGCVTDNTPIIMQFTHEAKLSISDAQHGIPFDLDLTGKKQMIGAPVDFNTTGFLYWVNGDTHNGENLFSNKSSQQKIEGVQPNGFLGLADWDDPMLFYGQVVGPKDNKITPNDGVWNLLRVWFDYNRNGLPDVGELKTLDELRVYQIDLDYKVSGRRDSRGNRLTFKSTFWIRDDPAPYVATDYFADTVAGN